MQESMIFALGFSSFLMIVALYRLIWAQVCNDVSRLELAADETAGAQSGSDKERRDAGLPDILKMVEAAEVSAQPPTASRKSYVLSYIGFCTSIVVFFYFCLGLSNGVAQTATKHASQRLGDLVSGSPQYVADFGLSVGGIEVASVLLLFIALVALVKRDALPGPFLIFHVTLFAVCLLSDFFKLSEGVDTGLLVDKSIWFIGIVVAISHGAFGLLYHNPLKAIPKTIIASSLSLITIVGARVLLNLLDAGFGASAMSFFVYVIVGYGVFGLHIYTLGRIGSMHLAVVKRRPAP